MIQKFEYLFVFTVLQRLLYTVPANGDNEGEIERVSVHRCSSSEECESGEGLELGETTEREWEREVRMRLASSKSVRKYRFGGQCAAA